MFMGAISESNFNPYAFGANRMPGYIGDLRERYLEDGAVQGMYTRASGSREWQRQAQGS
jgi:hypothetical protein